MFSFLHDLAFGAYESFSNFFSGLFGYHW